jgi:V-type H+-transporting ATPase subunit a
MAKWFRSEPMEYISIIMNEDAAHDCLADLGKLGVIQFTDVRSGRCTTFFANRYMIQYG